jgi:hypothetical protein
LVAQIFQSCHVAHLWKCHTVANGYFHKCPQSYFLPKLTPTSNLLHADGLKIEASDEFGERLLGYLNSSAPLASCRNCLGTAGRRFRHVQVKRAEFRGRQSEPTERLVDRRYLSQSRVFLARLRLRLSSAVLRMPGVKSTHRLK